MKIIHVRKYFIHALVQQNGIGDWELTTIYASPDPRRRRIIWDKLSLIQISNPWMCMGDFNCTLEEGEKGIAGGTSSSFIAWKDFLGLIDLGFTGPKYTWNNGIDPATRRSARLDKCLCTDEWRRAFLEAFVKHLPYSYSGHYPLLIQLFSKPRESLGVRPFCFQAVCL